MKCIITGCAGFIGSSLSDRLLKEGHKVLGIDNLSTGQLRFMEKSSDYERFTFIETDLLNIEQLKKIFNGYDIVFHLAANADVRFGTENPKRDLEQNTIVTYNVLEAMRHNNIKRIIFSSTGSVYGETEIIPTPEDAPFPVQTSFYGASKIASEGMIAAYCEGFNFQAWIFRFVSILGERYSHGHVFDFYKQLKQNPSKLKVLGNGKQRKSYLYIHDCLDAIMVAINKSDQKINIYNLGVDDYCEVNDSIKWICSALNVDPDLEYSGGEKGWIGDNPFIYLDTNKIQSLGWKPKVSIKEGVIKTIKFILQNEWILTERN